MAKLVFEMNVSLDGYVDHLKMPTNHDLYLHWVERAQSLTGSLYGRHVYGLMQYWDEDQADWNEGRNAFAVAWRKQAKWVVSRSLTSVGPNATVINDDIEAQVRKLKSEQSGEIAVAGPKLAQSLTDLGLIDEYRLYFHPYVLGSGTPFFAGPRPPLRFIGIDRFGGDVIRLSYVPA
jgi:dihydrofolate reductase